MMGANELVYDTSTSSFPERNKTTRSASTNLISYTHTFLAFALSLFLSLSRARALCVEVARATNGDSDKKSKIMFNAKKRDDILISNN